MNPMVELLSHPAARRVGWALVHFVWQGAVVAALLAAALRLLRNGPPQARWAAGCLALAVMAALPVVTAAVVSVDGPPAQAAAEAPAEPLAAGAAAGGAAMAPPPMAPRPAPPAAEDPIMAAPAPAGPADAPPPAARPPAAPWAQRARRALHPVLPWAVLAWVVGVVGLSVWHLGGWVLLARARRLGAPPDGAGVREAFEALRRRLAVRRPVRLLESVRVAVPAVVGWLRPVVLLPVGAMTGLTPRQLEAVLAHELAHVRRCDGLVRLLQAAVETLLFYHPAVWWVSARIRAESEQCCDDLAVAATGDRPGYARALARVAELGRRRPHLAAAATGGRLLPRIRRVLGLAQTPGRGATSWITGAVLLTALAAAALVIYGCGAGAPQAAQPGEARRLGPRQILRISVLDLFEEGKEAVFERQVSDGGTISLPLLEKRLKVQGLSQDDVHRAIVKAYAEAKILKSPSVAVMILSAKAAPPATQPGARRVRPGLILRISVLDLFEEGKEAVFERQVSDGGTISLPLLEKLLKVQGLSQDDVRSAIVKAYAEPKILKSPSVAVMILSAKAAPPATQPARGGAEWHSDALKKDLARLLREPRVSLINPRGKTVENLVVIKRAIEDYRLEKKALPASLKDLKLPAIILRDGSGRDLMWSGRVATYGHAPGKGSTILVGMRNPVSRLLKREQWWYAIIRTADGDIRISGGTELRELAAFTPSKASVERDKAGNLTVRLSPADAPAWGIKEGLNDLVVRRVKDDRLDIRIKGLQLPGGRTFRTRTTMEVKPGQKVRIGGTDRWQVSVERANRPATQPAGKSLGDAQKAFHKKWSIQGGWGAWGALSGANRARLLAQRTRWQPGQTPQFMVEAEGRGSIDFGVEPSQAAACRVELDGQWYDYAGKALKPERGAHFGVPISLTREWKGAAGRLALKPGKHSVRVAFPFPPPPAKRITWLVSAPLQFEIVNAKAAPPATRKADKPATQPAALDSDASTTLPSPGNGAWSKTVDGLRMRLVGPAAPVAIDETFELRMLIQNVSDEPIRLRRPLFLSVIRDPAEHPGNREEARWRGCVITATWPHRLKRLWSWHSSTRQTIAQPSILQPQATYTVIVTVRGPGGQREKARLKSGPQRETVRFLYHGLAGKYPLTATYAVPRGTPNVWCGTLVGAPVNVELVSPPATQAEWGKAIDGVQVRLRADKLIWKAGEKPTFKADIKGTEKWRLPLSQEICNLEVDGRLYFHKGKSNAWGKGVSGKVFADIPVRADERWFRTGSGELLVLKPGKHTIRLAVRPSPVERGLALKPAYRWSKPIQIQIQAAPTTQPATQPGDGKAMPQTQRGLELWRKVVADIGGVDFLLEHWNEKGTNVGGSRHSLMLLRTERASPKDWLSVAISHAQAKQVVAKLAELGIFDRLTDHTYDAGGPVPTWGPPQPKRLPGYLLHLLVRGQATRGEAFVDLSEGGDEAVAKIVRALRAGFAGQAADAADTVLGELGKGAPATQPAGSRLDFRIVPNAAGSSRLPVLPLFVGKPTEKFLARALKELADKGPDPARKRGDAFQWYEVAGEVNFPDAVIGKRRGRKYVLLATLAPHVMLAGKGKDAWGLAKVYTPYGSGRPVVGFEFDHRGAKRFAAFTKANVGNAVAILVDGKVLAAPVLRTALGSRGIIAGRFTDQQARDLVRTLKAGMPPGLVNSDILQTAAMRMLADFVVSESRKGRMPKGATQPEYLPKFIEGLKAKYPRSVMTTPAEEKALATGTFDDAGNARRLAAAAKRLEAAEAALPAVARFILKQQNDKALKGAKLEFARRLMEAIAADVSRAATAPATRRASPQATQPADGTPSKESWRAGIAAAKTPEEFMKAAAGRFAQIPGGSLVSLAALKREGALGSGWELSGSPAMRTDGSAQLIFVAQQEVLKIAGVTEVVAILEVFPTADAARKLALDRVFSGAAPTEYLLAMAKRHFLGEALAGDAYLGWGSFVRGNVAVRYGSAMREQNAHQASRHLDQALVALAQSSAPRAPDGASTQPPVRGTSTQATQPATAPADSELANSRTLQMAATRVLADYIVAEGRKGVMPKAATQPAYLVKFIEGLKARYPRSVMTTPPEEKALAAGKFDDAGNARRLAAAAKRLEAAEAALPAVARFILKQQNDKALKGAKLEFARRLMEAIAADVARAAASRESAALTKALNLTPAQQAKVKAWVKAWLEARKENQAPNPEPVFRFLNSILDDRQRALLRGIIESGTVPPTTQTGAATAPAPRP